jgi:hypothetical protein
MEDQMTNDPSDEHRKAPRRSGKEMRTDTDRRQEEGDWSFYEKRSGKPRRSGGDRRHEERRHAPDDAE